MANIERFNFFSDQYRLHGTLHLPDDTSNPPIIIGCHGLLATGDSPKQIALARLCADIGIVYLRFDHRGCGQSDGDFKKVTNLKGRCDDLKNAVKAITERFRSTYPVGLFGSSMGGAVCLSVAGEITTGPKVVIAAPVSTHDLNRPSQPEEPGVEPLSDSFYTDNLFFDLQEQLGKISNIMIFHGDMDAVVPVSNALRLYAEADQPKKLIIQKGGDHSMSDIDHQKQFQTEALQWFRNGFGL